MTKGFVDVEPVPPASFLSITNPQYRCPRHGQIEAVIMSTLGLNESKPVTYWCMHCALEKLDELGVNRAEPIT